MSMNRLGATILAVSTIALLAPAGAAARETPAPRTVGYAYSCSPCGLSFGPFGAAPATGVTFWPAANEHYLRLYIADETGQQIAFEAWQSGSGRYRFVGRGCGAGGPFLIEPGRDVTIFPLTGACMGGRNLPVSRPTTGTVWATFSAHRAVAR
jgi:hypothetical protein